MPRRAVLSASALPFILAATVVAPGAASAAFDADGYAFQPSAADRVWAAAVDQTADGGFVLAAGAERYGLGRGTCSVEICGSTDLVVTRLDENGNPVSTWGQDGRVVIPGHADDVSEVRVLADGSIAIWSLSGRWLLRLDAAGAVVREQALSGGQGESALQDGALDAAGTLHTFTASFSAESTTITSYGAGAPTTIELDDFMVSAGAVDGQGRFLLLSIPNGGVQQLIRLTPAGARDESFVAPNLPDPEWSVLLAVDGQDRPVVQLGAGWAAPWRFFRYTTTGAYDTSFGGDGEATVDDDDLGYGATSESDLTVQDDGKVVASGPGDDADRAVLRLNADGSADPTFDESAPDAADGDGIVLLDRDGSSVTAPVPVAIDRGVAIAFSGWDSRGSARGLENAPGATFTGVLRKAAPKPIVVPPVVEDKPPVVEQQPQSATPPPVTVAAQSRTRTTLRSCLSRRSFTIRLRPKALRSAKVTVAGKPATVTRRKGRLTARVDLRKLEQASFTVQVIAVDAKGRTVRETRTYRTCRYGKNGPKVKGGSIITVVQG